MSRADISLPQPRAFLETNRKDAWWGQPAAIAVGLVVFLVYGTWGAFHGKDYFFLGKDGQSYLSPFFSPLFYDTKSIVDLHRLSGGHLSGHAWFEGSEPGWWPSFLTFTPAFLILWAPGFFRFTCYGFRGHYYKGLWADPVSCAVGEPKFRGEKYRGEAKLPLILQNLHRYFLYVIIVLLAVKLYDTWHELFFYVDPNNHDAGRTLGLAVGSVILIIEPILLILYVGGCHSLRHLIGGKFDEISKRPARKKAYDCVSCLNGRHMLWGWASLLWIMFADVYVRLCSMGVIHDVVLFKLRSS